MKATRFDQFLQSREELKFVDRPHWIYVVEAIIWSAIIIGFGIFASQAIAATFIYPALGQNLAADGFFINIAAWASFALLWGSIVFAVIYFLIKLIFWASTYVFASDRRLYMKTGLMRVLVNEVSFDEIRKTDINYGWFGRFLGYGKLMMDARFVEDTDLPFIYYPEQFSKLVHYSNDLDGDMNLSYVTNGMKGKADQIIPEKAKVQDQIEPMRKQAEFVEQAYEKNDNQELENEGDLIHKDFEDVVDIPDNNINKPADTSTPSKVDM